MSGRGWTAVGLLCLVASVGGALLLKEMIAGRKRAREATAADLRREREENRQEAAIAFNDPVAPSAAEAAEFVRVLGKVSDAVRDENGAALIGILDPDRMFDELIRQGGPGMVIRNTPRDRTAFTDGFRGAGRNVVFNPLFQWDSTAVRRVRWSADRNEAVVVAAHRRQLQAFGEDLPVTYKIRWWFVRRGGDWRVYDFEDLDGGIRLMPLLASLASPRFAPRLPRVRAAAESVREAFQAATRSDLPAFQAAIDRCRGDDLPDPIRAMVAVLDSYLEIGKGDADAALRHLGRAEALYPDMPLRHVVRATCLNLKGDHEGALAAADAYVAQLGPDGDVDVQRGVALAGLNRPGEAADAYRRALDDHPDSKEAIDGLRRALPAADKGELGDRLAKAADPGRLFDQAVGLARQAGDAAAEQAYEAGLRKARPNDPRGVTARVRRLVDQKKFADAAAEMRVGLGRVAGEGRDQVLNAYLFAMLGADRAVEGYAAAPAEHAPAAFRLLADELEESLPEPGPGAEAAGRPLRELLAAHRKRVPADPWAGYYDGVLLQAAGEYEKAERAFAAAGAAYLGAAKPAGKAGGEGEKDWEADRFRSRRVACLLALGQGARAYNEVGPVRDTFAQLAHAYEWEQDWETLGEMVAVHRKEHPDDPGGAYWAANVLYLRGDYAPAADGFRKFLAAAADRDADSWQAADRCVRGYLRAGKLRKAREAADEFGEKRVGAGLRAALALAAGDESGADAILAETTKHGGPTFVYYDEDFARLIAGPAFAALRKKYPDPRPVKPVGPPG